MEHIVIPPKQNLLQMLVFSHIIDKKLSENFSKPWKFLKIAVASVIVSYKLVSYKGKALDDSEIAKNVVAETH